VTLGYGDFLRGLEEFKALPLKDRSQQLKNEVFNVSLMMIMHGLVLVHQQISALIMPCLPSSCCMLIGTP